MQNTVVILEGDTINLAIIKEQINAKINAERLLDVISKKSSNVFGKWLEKLKT